MNRIHRQQFTPSNTSNNLDLVGYKVITKLYSQVRAIFAELGESDTLLLRALRDGHGIEFDSLRTDPALFFVIGSDQIEKLQEAEIDSPTFLQLMGTAEVISLVESDAIAKWKALKGVQ